jgi:hypothetical protein
MCTCNCCFLFWLILEQEKGQSKALKDGKVLFSPLHRLAERGRGQPGLERLLCGQCAGGRIEAELVGAAEEARAAMPPTAGQCPSNFTMEPSVSTTLATGLPSSQRRRTTCSTGAVRRWRHGAIPTVGVEVELERAGVAVGGRRAAAVRWRARMGTSGEMEGTAPAPAGARVHNRIRTRDRPWMPARRSSLGACAV